MDACTSEPSTACCTASGFRDRGDHESVFFSVSPVPCLQHCQRAKPGRELAHIWRRCSAFRLGRDGPEDYQAERKGSSTPVEDEARDPAEGSAITAATADYRETYFVPRIQGTRFRRDERGHYLRD